MITSKVVHRISPLTEPLDILLADVAIRVQLSRTNYQKAENRYKTIQDWIDREGSPLQGKVRLLYPQGGMAQGATVAVRATNDEYDLDIIAEVDLPPWLTPRQVLDHLYNAIRGEPGSRYYSMTKRNSRCVTIQYEDRMHLDITPAILLAGRDPRTSNIFHSKPEDPSEPELRLIANPFGFVEWFKRETPPDNAFALAFARREALWDVMRVVAKAPALDVPAQEQAHQKSKAVIILQLIKRFRNLRYARRDSIRQPPSVLISKLIADAANGTVRLSDELLHQARSLRRALDVAESSGTLIRVVNPTCPEDVFSDRWPGTREAQRLFISDLSHLIRQTERLVAGGDLAQMRAIMIDLFGEAPTGDVFKRFNEVAGTVISSGQSFHEPQTGRFVPAAPRILTGAAAATIGAAAPTRAHTFFGD